MSLPDPAARRPDQTGAPHPSAGNQPTWVPPLTQPGGGQAPRPAVPLLRTPYQAPPSDDIETIALPAPTTPGDPATVTGPATNAASPLDDLFADTNLMPTVQLPLDSAPAAQPDDHVAAEPASVAAPAESRRRARPARTRLPLVRPADAVWLILGVIASGLGLSFLAFAAARWSPADPFTPGAAIYTAIGLVLLGAAIASAAFSPITAVLVGGAVTGVGIWWWFAPGSALQGLEWITSRPLAAAVPDLCDAGLPLLFGLTALLGGIVSGAARVIGRSVAAPEPVFHWIMLPIALALTTSAGVMLVLSDRANSTPNWLVLGGCATAGMACAMARISPVPTMVGGAIIPFGLGALLLVGAAGWLWLPTAMTRQFDNPALAGTQLFGIGLFMVAAAIAGRAGRLPKPGE